MYNFDAPSWSDLCGVAASLNTMNFITLEHGLPEIGSRSRINVSENDLRIVFKDDTLFEKIISDSNK
jgi:hypothetical protein